MAAGGRVSINEVVIEDMGGAPVTGATVNVYAARTTTPVTVFQNETGGATLSNPVTTAGGVIPGWLPEGEYDLKVTFGAGAPVTRRFNAVIGANPLLAADQVTATEIAAGAVGSSEIADGSVLSAEIGANQVIDSKIPTNTVSHSKLVNVAGGQLLVGDSGGILTARTLGGDGALSNAGSLTIPLWRKELHSGGMVFNGTGGAATYLLGTSGANGIIASGVGLGAGTGNYPIPLFVFTSADLAGGGTTRFKVKAQALVASAAPAITFTVGLHNVSSVAGTPLAYTVGAAISGSTVAFASPGLNTRNTGDSSGFDASALTNNEIYALCVALSGTPASLSHTNLTAQLVTRNS